MIMRDYVTSDERLKFKRSWKEILIHILSFIGFISLFLLGGIHV